MGGPADTEKRIASESWIGNKYRSYSRPKLLAEIDTFSQHSHGWSAWGTRQSHRNAAREALPG